MLIGCIRCHGPLDGENKCPMCDYDMAAEDAKIDKMLAAAERNFGYVQIGDGIRNIWIVTSRYSDGSGKPEFLAAYDGEKAEGSAKALVELIERGGSYQIVEATAVPLWPCLTLGQGEKS